MHYFCLAVLPPGTTDVDEAVSELLDPHREGWSDDDELAGWWDWYQIGGRWTGSLSDYDPHTDPANLDENGKVLWPTQWRRYAGDIARLGSVRLKLLESLPYRIIGPEIHACTETYHRGRPYPECFEEHPEQVLAMLTQLSDECVVVVVDYHN